MPWLESLTWVDLVVLGIITVSMLLSLFRGLVKEVASLAVWVLAIVGASRLAHFVADVLPDWLTAPLQQTLAFLIVLVVILVVGKLLIMLAKEIVSAAGISGLDRVLGMAFGMARGALLVVVLAILASMTALPSQLAWQKAKSRAFLELGIRTAAPWLPRPVGDRLRLPDSPTSKMGPMGSSACVA